MDIKNHFHTRTTYNLLRVDFLVLLLIQVMLIVVHWSDINWWHFALAFWWIDLFGYVPAAIYYYTGSEQRRAAMPKGFYVIYNFTHSVAVNVIMTCLWFMFVGEWQWAMLAATTHLCIDRSVFGNIFKPFGLSFEPVQNFAFQQFYQEFNRPKA